jgi:hypothetical protein
VAGEERPLETGWLADTPVEDNLLRQFVFNQAGVNEAVATGLGGRVERVEGVLLADAQSPVPFSNQALLTRPLAGSDDPVLDEVEGFFAGASQPSTLLSMWPTPDLAPRGWMLMGHPALVVRAPGPSSFVAPPDVDVVVVTTAEELATVERVAAEGYPIEPAQGAPPGTVFPPAMLGTTVTARFGLLAGEPVAAALSSAACGVVNLCLGATLPAARRRGVWEALVWARLGDAPALPAVAYTSDFSRPGFLRMGFLPVTRFTLWLRLPGT